MGSVDVVLSVIARRVRRVGLRLCAPWGGRLDSYVVNCILLGGVLHHGSVLVLWRLSVCDDNASWAPAASRFRLCPDNVGGRCCVVNSCVAFGQVRMADSHDWVGSTAPGLVAWVSLVMPVCRLGYTTILFTLIYTFIKMIMRGG